MDEIKQRDRELYRKELLKVGSMPFFLILLTGVFAVVWRNFLPTFPAFLLYALVMSLIIGAHIRTSYEASVRRRFHFGRLGALWTQCEERLTMLKEATDKLAKSQIAELTEMPNVIDRVAKTLYIALRRSDIVLQELSQSEGPMMQKILTGANPTGSIAENVEAKQLYGIADRNVAEYKRSYASVLHGVQVAEAQAAVFITTLDALRVKMLSYRITGKSPQLPQAEFIGAMKEAKMQLECIDKALDELDISSSLRAASGAIVPPPYEPLEQQIRGSSEG